MRYLKSYEHTIYASYFGYITQAIINNFAPLLFLTFTTEFNLTLDKIALITSVNFMVQLIVDLLATRLVDKIGYRVSIVIAHLFCAIGIIGLGIFSYLFSNSFVGILTSVILYAIGGGIIEVLISPIVEACPTPTKKKESIMSLLHSFYCWGHMAVVIISTIFFRVFGIINWRILCFFWAIIPICNFFYFLFVPLYPIVNAKEKMSIKAILNNKIFWILILLMICAGSAEQAMSQWSSTFAEMALGITKTLGDLLGPCFFALMMGISRTIYAKQSEKISLDKMIFFSAILCILCYLIATTSNNSIIALISCGLCGFSVGIFWPGTFSLAAKKLPKGGTSMYALMALAGDIGCGGGPTMVGFIANVKNANLKFGLKFAIVFPILIIICLFLLKNKKNNNNIQKY